MMTTAITNYLTRRQQELLTLLWNNGQPQTLMALIGVWIQPKNLYGEAFGYSTVYALVEAGWAALGYDEDVLRSDAYKASLVSVSQALKYNDTSIFYCSRMRAAMSHLGLTPAGERMAALLAGEWVE